MSAIARLSTARESEVIPFEVIVHICGCCHLHETKIIRIGTLFNFSWVCQNTDCVMFIDLEKVMTWRKV